MSLLTHFIPSFTRSTDRDNASGDAPDLSIKPAYNVTETPEAFRLTVALPGVSKENVEVTADSEEVRVVGRRTWKQPEGWTPLHRETTGANYELVLTHEAAIDADKIVAELRDGVLNVTLAKHEAVKPRKIAIA